MYVEEAWCVCVCALFLPVPLKRVAAGLVGLWPSGRNKARILFIHYFTAMDNYHFLVTVLMMKEQELVASDLYFLFFIVP